MPEDSKQEYESGKPTQGEKPKPKPPIATQPDLPRPMPTVEKPEVPHTHDAEFKVLWKAVDRDEKDIDDLDADVAKLEGETAKLDDKLSKIKPQKPDILHTAPWITLAAILGLVLLGYSGTYQFQGYTYLGYVGVLAAIVTAAGCYLYRLNQS
jgi:hypothetical protein